MVEEEYAIVIFPAEKFPEASRATMVEAVFASVAFVPMVIPVEPLYEVPVRYVPNDNVAKFEPRAIPLMVEFVRPELLSVPDMFGVNVRAPDEGTMF